MKILLYGVGAIGSLVTHYLIKAGNDVTVVARSTAEVLILIFNQSVDKKSAQNPYMRAFA